MPLFTPGSQLSALPQAPSADPRLFAADPQAALATAQIGLLVGKELAGLQNQQARLDLEKAEIAAKKAQNEFQRQMTDHALSNIGAFHTNLVDTVLAQSAQARATRASSQLAEAVDTGLLSSGFANNKVRLANVLLRAQEEQTPLETRRKLADVTEAEAKASSAPAVAAAQKAEAERQQELSTIQLNAIRNGPTTAPAAPAGPSRSGIAPVKWDQVSAFTHDEETPFTVQDNDGLWRIQPFRSKLTGGRVAVETLVQSAADPREIRKAVGEAQVDANKKLQPIDTALQRIDAFQKYLAKDAASRSRFSITWEPPLANTEFKNVRDLMNAAVLDALANNEGERKQISETLPTSFASGFFVGKTADQLQARLEGLKRSLLDKRELVLRQAEDVVQAKTGGAMTISSAAVEKRSVAPRNDLAVGTVADITFNGTTIRAVVVEKDGKKFYQPLQ